MYKVNDEQRVFVYGVHTQFGGNKSSGFALIYDSLEDAKKYEPRYRKARVRALLG
jgi:small subunit ribosomal protein S24e